MNWVILYVTSSEHQSVYFKDWHFLLWFQNEYFKHDWSKMIVSEIARKNSTFDKLLFLHNTIILNRSYSILIWLDLTVPYSYKVTWMVFILKLLELLTLIWLGLNLPLPLPPPCGFLKNVSSKERVEPWFFVTFNIILKHIFSGNFIEFPQFIQKIRRNSPSILAIFINSPQFFGFFNITLLQRN